jgi:hypothetical protein
VINFLKSLPQESYRSFEAAMRDFAEAERRFASGNLHRGGPDRRNIGRPFAEDAPDGVSTRHP